MIAACVQALKKPVYSRDHENESELVRLNSGAWAFAYAPLQLNDCDLRGLYNGAILLSPEKLDCAERGLTRFLKVHPGHLKGLTDLASVHYRKGNLEKSFSFAADTIQSGLAGLKSSGFSMRRDKLDGSIPENQPFLHAFLYAGAISMELGDMEAAVEFFERVLKIDPQDYCKARGFAMEAYLHLDQPGKAYKVCEKYSHRDDKLIDILYGIPLIHLKLGRVDEAELAVRKAVASNPKVAVQLLRVRESEMAWPQRSLFPGIKKMAAHYRRRMGKIWNETDGAMTLLRKYTF